jgi:type VI secretion system secreted protein VgrG
MRPTQDTRIAELTTPLGKDKLVLVRFDASEGLSELFEIHIDCESEERIDLGDLLGKESSVRVYTLSGETRYFSGIVVEGRDLGTTKRDRKDVTGYRLVLRPWTWLLSQSVDSRIFQDKTLKNIFEEVFELAGFQDFRVGDGTSEMLSYCVQYRETHLDFVLRLMEEFGIHFYFEHEAGKHTMVLGESMSHKTIEALETVPLIPMGERTRDNKEYLRGWTSERTLQTGGVVVSGYDFASPDHQMLHQEFKPGGYGHDKFEVFVYPHKYKASESARSKAFAQATLEARQTRDHRRYADGNAPSLYPGGCVTLERHDVDAENIRYIVVAARHSVVAQHYRSGGGGGAGEAYSGNYVLQPADRQFRPPQVTPRPIVHGPQTAIVVGPDGEEIHTDKYGRVKVMFHWDRDARKERNRSSGNGADHRRDPPKEHASRWIRVAHTWSGKQWGSIYIPRIGMEVVVEFIEGDPDRPLIVGTVYNANNMPPQALPANKTQRGLKTRSSMGGGEDNYNELWFEDKKDQEEIRLHAEKDLNSTIENTETRIVKGKFISGPGEATRTTTIENGDDVLEIQKGDHNVTISRHHKEDVGQNETITIGQNQDVSIGVNQTHTAGMETMIEAGVKLTLKVGGSTITMTPASIEIKTSLLSTDAPITNINASGIITATGGLIKLN